MVGSISTPCHKRARAAGVALALTATVVVGGCSEWRERPDAPRPVRESASAVTVRAGDTVYGVSRRHGVPVRAVVAANNLRPPYTIAVGQRLVLPRARFHQVARGDTVHNIARRYGVHRSALIRANAIAPPYTIHIGQRLRLPGATTASGPVLSARAQTTQNAAGPRAKLPRPAARAGRRFLWPVRGRVVSRFGAKRGGLHNDGINIAAARGAQVKAAENGVVAYAGNELRGFGNLVLLKHAKGWTTAYAHNDTVLVRRGDKVRRGQPIARVGSSGNVDRPQLHFEIRRGTDAINPEPLLASLPVESAAR